MPKFDAFIGGMGAGRSIQADDELTENFYIENVPPNGATKSRRMLLGRAGLLELVSLPNAASVRAIYECDGLVFAVAGGVFYQVFQNGTFNAIATIQAGTDLPAEITASPTQVLVLYNGSGYCYTISTTTFTEITSNFPANVVKCGFADGYFIVQVAATQQFWISNLNDGLTWQALNFASAEGEQGNVISFIVDHRQLWFFCDTHGEIYYDAGFANFAYARLEGAFWEQGAISVDACCQFDSSIAFLNQNRDGGRQVMRMIGYQPVRISTHALETRLASYSTVSDAVMWTFQDQGHTFLTLHCPSANNGNGATFVFDTASSEWAEWYFWQNGTKYGHLGRRHCYAWGSTHLVGDWRSGTIYIQSTNYATDNGTPIRRRRRAPAMSSGGKRTFYLEFRLICDTGVGLDGGANPGATPQVVLRWSNDGGNTWSMDRPKLMGAIGAFGTILRWPNLGSSLNRAFEIEITDPVKVAIVGAELDIEAAAA